MSIITVYNKIDLTRCSQECLDELYEEAVTIDKERNGQLLRIEHINKMIKLDSFLRESLRHTGDIGNVLLVLHAKFCGCA